MNRQATTIFAGRFVKALACCAFLFAMSAASAAALTEAAVRDLIGAVDRAVQTRDVQAMGKLLSSGFRVNVELSAHGNKQVLDLTKAQYLDMLRDSWDGLSGYTYRRSGLKIRLLPDGASAEVSATVRETATTQGHVIRMNTEETATVRWVDGRLQVTKVVARTRSE